MKRAAFLATALSATCLLTVPAAPADAHQRPATYVLQGDPGDPQGSKFEGIGVDRSQRTFYVSETTGGEVHRGNVRTGRTEVWLQEGADGRSTARGITVDRRGRVYVAGGPNSSQSGGPDLWVYAPDGRLLAALRVDVPNRFSTTSPSGRTVRPTSPTPTPRRFSGSPSRTVGGRSAPGPTPPA